MPGAHTFYDGARIFEPIADVFGVECDKVNLVFCQVLGIVSAIVYYKYFPSNATSRTARLAYPLAVGIFQCFFCYGQAIKHLVIVISVCYVIMKLAPSRHVHRLVFLYSMGHLMFIHWFRFYVITAYYIDVTGSMMIMVQKVTTLAFSLHDGTVKKPEELNEIQKREAIKECPPILDYLSYMFHFQTILTGPLCFYTDYQRFITGENLKTDNKSLTPPNPMPFALQKLAFSGFCFVLLVFIAPSYPPEILMDNELSARLGVILYPLLFFFVIVLQRVQYYYAWVIADATCNLSGLGFAGYDENGNEKWNLVSNVNPYGVEMALSFKETLDNWNCTTGYWLRRVAYDRVPKNMRTVSTYLLSALWHGVFPGYYLTFLTGALVTVSARTARRCLRWRFQDSDASRRGYDIATSFATKVALQYTTFPFVTMNLNPGLQLYKETYFFMHIICILAITVLPVILPPQKTSKPAAAAADGDAKKNGIPRSTDSSTEELIAETVYGEQPTSVDAGKEIKVE